MISCYQHNETDNFNKLSCEYLRNEGSKYWVCVLYRRFNSMVTLSGGLKILNSQRLTFARGGH